MSTPKYHRIMIVPAAPVEQPKPKVPKEHHGIRRMPLQIALLIVMGAAVGAMAPQQIPVLLYKLLMLSVSLVFAYAADKTLFRNADPDMNEATNERDIFGAARVLARALIFVGVVLGFTMGL